MTIRATTAEVVIRIKCKAHGRVVITDSTYPTLIPLPVARALARGKHSASLSEWDGAFVVDFEDVALYCPTFFASDQHCRGDWYVEVTSR